MVHNVAGYKITNKYRNLKIFIVKFSFSYILMRIVFVKWAKVLPINHKSKQKKINPLLIWFFFCTFAEKENDAKDI